MQTGSDYAVLTGTYPIEARREFGFIRNYNLSAEDANKVGYRSDIFVHIRAIDTPQPFAQGQDINGLKVTDIHVKRGDRGWLVTECRLLIEETIYTLHPTRCIVIETHLIGLKVESTTLHVLDESKFGSSWKEGRICLREEKLRELKEKPGTTEVLRQVLSYVHRR